MKSIRNNNYKEYELFYSDEDGDWVEVNNFLRREKTRTESALNHARIVFYAAILLEFIFFVLLLFSILDKRQANLVRQQRHVFVFELSNSGLPKNPPTTYEVTKRFPKVVEGSFKTNTVIRMIQAILAFIFAVVLIWFIGILGSKFGSSLLNTQKRLADVFYEAEEYSGKKMPETTKRILQEMKAEEIKL